MPEFSDDFSEAALDSRYWILNNTSYLYNPGWGAGAPNGAVLDTVNDRLKMKASTSFNGGYADLFLPLEDGFTLTFDAYANITSGGLLVCWKQLAGDNSYNINWQLEQAGKIVVTHRVNGASTVLGTYSVSPLNGTIEISVLNQVLTVKYNNNTIYSGAFTETPDNFITFYCSGWQTCYIDNVHVDYVNTECTALFSASSVSGMAPLTVNFTDQSLNSPTSWLWDFGDGGTSTEQNPSHVYTAEGTYTITLTATNSSGSDSEVKTGYISVVDYGKTVLATNVGEPEIAVYGVVDGFLYWGGLWQTSQLGHVFKTNISTGVTTTLKTGVMLANWQGGVINGMIYTSGQEDTPGVGTPTGGRYAKAVIQSINPATGEVIRAYHPDTDDCNEFMAFGTDGEFIVVGERPGYPGNTANSDYPDGSGIWKIPIATFTDTGTWVRTWEDPNLWSHQNVLKLGNTWYLLIDNGEGYCDWRVVKSTDLINWTTELDLGEYASYSFNESCLIKAGEGMVLLAPHMDDQFHLFRYNGSWTNVDLDIDIPSDINFIEGVYDHYRDKIVFVVGNWDSKVCSIYECNVDGTGLRALFTNQPGLLNMVPSLLGSSVIYLSDNGRKVNIPLPFCYTTSSNAEVQVLSFVRNVKTSSRIIPKLRKRTIGWE
ncbi:PKD domain-containing protein [Methanobacterium sp. CWC-01]|uniref:PKD domain-containing protein n=1 Tax=Methanobacterium aridiramus TaxID=2584467 RepID=UPI002576CEBB|nr:PKD domain-containing protein [Methanobacterium sp. CWC-01]WJI09196.1 PKD domain-containing protein [Methanobacterium sp. CWC-01]